MSVIAGRTRLAPFAIVALIILNVSVAAKAEEVNTNTFVVHTKVSINEAGRDPVTQSMQTIFDGTKVYDTTTSDPGSVIAKFDLRERMVRLIDPKRRIRTAISFHEIAEFQANACALALERKKLIGFMAKPQFKYAFDPAARSIELKSPWMTYKAIGLREQGVANVVDRFTEFADWTKQLSTVLYDGAPAQARIKLNSELKKRNFQVARVVLHIGDDLQATSSHEYVYELNASQQDFIRDVEKKLNTFDKVAFGPFRGERKLARVAVKK